VSVARVADDLEAAVGQQLTEALAETVVVVDDQNGDRIFIRPFRTATHFRSHRRIVTPLRKKPDRAKELRQ
jgi:hypothetical protein